ncbi:thioredoxin family protein [Thiohalophilus sp.]|uniref:thioredoxin family protein n=1 Tax=Thiohalophilus sp. TaxID=3028392 RepID=UPI002ACEB979|nr:thioredoxin family protein [Thiohalophilus sp.]MDZ7661566.1 thioredoxin family protein [Thiohalophilus sp.]
MNLFIFGLILAVVGFLLWWQWSMLRQARRYVGRPAPDTTAVDGANRAARRIYFFHAVHCGPCRAVAPLVDRLCREYPNLVKVDVASHPALARRFGVAATPSFIIVANDRIDEVRLGGVTEAWLRNRLNIEEAP